MCSGPKRAISAVKRIAQITSGMDRALTTGSEIEPDARYRLLLAETVVEVIAHGLLYDNTRLAVAKIPGDGGRQRARAFTGLQLLYLFEDRFGRPGKGNDKGKVEGMVG